MPTSTLEELPPTNAMHRFRTKVLDLASIHGRLVALTEGGAYMLDKNGKRWRKVAAAIRQSALKGE